MNTLSSRWFAGVLIASCPLTAARAEVPIQSSAFCTAFLKIYDNRTEKFARLAGLRDPDSGSGAYFPLVTAPNADFCTLSSSGQNFGTSTFTCFWRYDNRDLAVSQAEGLADSILRCLPPRIRVNEGIASSNRTIFRRIFDEPDRLSKTRVRVWAKDQPSLSGAYVLTLGIQYADEPIEDSDSE